MFEYPTVKFATRAQRQGVVRLNWSLRLFMGAEAPKSKPAMRFVDPHLLGKLRSSSNPTNKNLKDLGTNIQTALSQ